MAVLEFPSRPDVPEAQKNAGTAGTRYEDISQDGALKVCSMPHALGTVCFRDLWHHHPINQVYRPQGVVPILARLTLATAEAPISVRNAIECEGQFALGTLRDEAGKVQRLVMNMDADLFAPRARTYDPQPAGAGQRIPVGHIHAEHVFTRPFGPPQQRKVTSLTLDGTSAVPDVPLVHARPRDLLELPATAEWVEQDYERDPVHHSFGLVHTDSNQHVNSLVYPLLFEDAMVRRMADLGASTREALLAHIDLCFRKPCFAGDRVQLHLRSFRVQDQWGAVGYLAPAGVALDRAHVTCRMLMR